MLYNDRIAAAVLAKQKRVSFDAVVETIRRATNRLQRKQIRTASLHERSAYCGRRASCFFFQERNKVVLTEACVFFELVQQNLNLVASARPEPQYWGSCAFGRMVEQALIHVPNLFDIERTERQPARLNPTSR
ncbi:hypothetical protein, partial [Pseudomonas sp. 32_A]|uniref:hypothetical protein n=1 Tax=Pseudomonas sp. 32_A TaxID=2813559 RepID=UPI001A9D196E